MPAHSVASKCGEALVRACCCVGLPIFSAAGDGFVVDIVPLQCYDNHDNLIEVPWQLRRRTFTAEQDNRVKIPNGTAAVCGMVLPFGESQSLEVIPGRQEGLRMTQHPKATSQKTYGMDLPFSA